MPLPACVALLASCCCRDLPRTELGFLFTWITNYSVVVDGKVERGPPSASQNFPVQITAIAGSCWNRLEWLQAEPLSLSLACFLQGMHSALPVAQEVMFMEPQRGANLIER